MIDPVSITAIKGACDVAIGAIPQIFPLVHDENTRKRLARLDVLLQKVGDESLTPEELTEAKELHSRVHVHALMTQNATILAYLEKGMLLLRVQKSKRAEKQIDLIMLDEDCEERSTKQTLTAPSSPALISIKSKASIPEVAKFVLLEEQSLLFDPSVSAPHQVAPPETTPPAYSPASPGVSLPSKDREEREDPIIEEISNAKKPKTHPNLKKAVCWSLVLTIGPAALLAPQVRRNLLSSRTTP
jgi:hypothetical protein